MDMVDVPIFIIVAIGEDEMFISIMVHTCERIRGFTEVARGTYSTVIEPVNFQSEHVDIHAWAKFVVRAHASGSQTNLATRMAQVGLVNGFRGPGRFKNDIG